VVRFAGLVAPSAVVRALADVDFAPIHRIAVAVPESRYARFDDAFSDGTGTHGVRRGARAVACAAVVERVQVRLAAIGVVVVAVGSAGIALVDGAGAGRARSFASHDGARLAALPAIVQRSQVRFTSVRAQRIAIAPAGEARVDLALAVVADGDGVRHRARTPAGAAVVERPDVGLTAVEEVPVAVPEGFFALGDDALAICTAHDPVVAGIAWIAPSWRAAIVWIVRIGAYAVTELVGREASYVRRSDVDGGVGPGGRATGGSIGSEPSRAVEGARGESACHRHDGNAGRPGCPICSFVGGHGLP